MALSNSLPVSAPFFFNIARKTPLSIILSGLRGLDVTFPPHDSRFVGLNPEVVEFLRAEKFREQVLREGL